jgi:Protein of unknown function (DUF2842)
MSDSRPPPAAPRARVLIATAVAIVFVLAYIAVVVTLPDLLPRQHWAVQAFYWCVAGVLWVVPVWVLLLFASGRKRRHANARRTDA